jgi:hypothetical protein
VTEDLLCKLAFHLLSEGVRLPPKLVEERVCKPGDSFAVGRVVPNDQHEGLEQSQVEFVKLVLGDRVRIETFVFKTENLGFNETVWLEGLVAKLLGHCLIVDQLDQVEHAFYNPLLSQTGLYVLVGPFVLRLRRFEQCVHSLDHLEQPSR